MISTKYLIAFFFITSTPLLAQFKSQDEVSMVITTGNSELNTYSIKSNNSYRYDKNTFIFKGNYTYGEANEVRNNEHWDFLLRYERSFNERLGLFIGELIEADRFLDLKRRYSSDVGTKYEVFKSKSNKTSFEIGYRYAVEKKTDALEKVSKTSSARLYAKTAQKIKEDIIFSFWGEYLPNFTKKEKFLVNFGPSFSLVLTKVLSLKLEYIWKYNNQPGSGIKKHNTTYTTGLIANF